MAAGFKLQSTAGTAYFTVDEDGAITTTGVVDTGTAGIKADVIAESSSGVGVAIDGLTARDGTYQVSVSGTSTAAAGSTGSDAAALPSGAGAYTVTGADGTKGVKINATDQVTGRTFIIHHTVGGTGLKVYPPSGGNINGLGVDVATSVTKSVQCTCINATSKTWAVV